MTTTATPLPHWDLTPIFPSLESSEFDTAFEATVQEIAALADLFAERNVRRRSQPDVNAEFVAAYEEITDRVNMLQQQVRTLAAYLHCFTSTDATNDTAQSRLSQLNTQTVMLTQLLTRYVAWVGSSDQDALLTASETARSHAFHLQKAQYMAAHQMSEAEESLSAELRPSGILGWSRLHSEMSARLTVDVEINGEKQTLPMSAVRGLGGDPKRAVRRAAFEAEVAAWERTAVPFAAALNGIKGNQQTLRRRRGYADDVEPTLFANSIDAPTLAAMHQACVESFPDFRRYMDAKAHALGLEQLAWYDLFAPVGQAVKSWSWADAQEFVLRNFGCYSPRLAEFADRSFREEWHDAEPRVGKQGGAYCTGIRAGESRLFMNFDGSFAAVSTLAHELGHGYHNLNLQDRTFLQRGTPSTLAETASIFCETLSFDAALEHADEAERLVLLDTSLQRDLMVVVDIHSRFLFEKRLFEKRTARDLTIRELNALMTQAQRETYGECLDPLHPYMWAVKGHYYGGSFYNYPYTFGLLFGTGLYALYQRDPDAFRAQYDDLLSSTGMADAKTLATRFGIDITNVAFWRSSLDVIRRQIAEFERLVG